MATFAKASDIPHGVLDCFLLLRTGHGSQLGQGQGLSMRIHFRLRTA